MHFATVLSSLFVLATLGLAAPIAEPTPDVVAVSLCPLHRIMYWPFRLTHASVMRSLHVEAWGTAILSVAPTERMRLIFPGMTPIVVSW